MGRAAFSTASPEVRIRIVALYVVLVALAWRATGLLTVLEHHPLAVDFHVLWAGARALAEPNRVYDFAYVSALQGWPMGPGDLRPFVYPPSALLAFAPFAALPVFTGFAVWLALTYPLFALGARRVGAPWWIVAFPVVWMVGICGQVTFLIAGLMAFALTLRSRPMLAGALLGVAAAIKPQMLVFAPLALIALKDWRGLAAAGVAGAGMGLASLALWGPALWWDWLAALPRFQTEVFEPNPGLMRNAITPYAVLTRFGFDGRWAYLLAPLAIGMVWDSFRREASAADRLFALVAGALIVSPYAMNYETCALLPAVAAYLARVEDRLWPLYAVLAVAFALGVVVPMASILVVLALWAIGRTRGNRVAASKTLEPAVS